MILTKAGLSDPGYKEKGYTLPAFDIGKMREKTRLAPRWLHFGAGNIFRALPAASLQTLLDSGEYDTGLIVAEGFDQEILDRVYTPNDNLSLLVTLKADGKTEKRVIASVAETLKADRSHKGDWARLCEIFKEPGLQLVSFTITEKGYSADSAIFRDDATGGPEAVSGLMGQVAALLLARFETNGAPIAMVSMDNCSRNGDKLKTAVVKMAGAWVKTGKAPAKFLDWLEDEKHVSFPWSMIDKITPRPDEKVRGTLLAEGFEAADIIETSRHTFIAPFVNAEEAEYLVIEDTFPAGRPPLEKGGMIFADRDTVNRMEKMKVCSCLNPLHTTLAVFGCLLGHTLIHREMADRDLKTLVTRLGWEECLPVVVDPGIMKPEDFLRQVLEVRFPNPFMPDTPQRIATDTSQKIPIRFGETVKAYMKRGEAEKLRFVPLALAGWLRYLTGIDDEGKKFELSPDPMLGQLAQYTEGIVGGAPDFDESTLLPLLKNSDIFGVDLCESGLAGKVTDYLRDMLRGPGAVRKTIQKAII